MIRDAVATSVPKIPINENKFIFKLQSAFFGNFETVTVSECCLIKLLPYILFEKYIDILAVKMDGPGNQHCASCIGTLSFPPLEWRLPRRSPNFSVVAIPGS